ncbi:gamma-glutamylcyclotransferase family protein [uncultured Halopseudomonas sp.]|mgnify:CR=1 FL=1|uniref:gamma-glutamylcyclotransferase family protein n=1 Tax=uncultured Halopseudomonas sp. TaxID=2901193 RepID=UPI0030EB33AF|tara:strand:- start:4267 stop:5079 length:813 start_codon:yes stop_codon:yes gene_type:complete
MFHYFGFGSNMSLLSLRAKGIEPLASTRAVLHGWRLRFNVQHFFRHEGGVGNIEYTGHPDDRVLGVLHECADEALALLDAAEAYGHGYDRIEVAVETIHLDAGTQSQVPALTYVGMPEFLDNSCLPSRRYLNIILHGGRQAGLDEDYLNSLAGQPLHRAEDYPPYVAPPGDYPTFDRDSLAEQPLLTALYGAVFDMSPARPLHTFLKGFFGGKDMTLYHLRRLDTSNLDETIDDITRGRLNQAQQQYLNVYLNEYAREYRYAGRYIYNKD